MEWQKKPIQILDVQLLYEFSRIFVSTKTVTVACMRCRANQTKVVVVKLANRMERKEGAIRCQHFM